MFFVEYTEHDDRKALNLAMCQTIETYVYETGSRNEYALYIYHEKFGKQTIEFKSKEELFSTFDSLMDAIKHIRVIGCLRILYVMLQTALKYVVRKCF
ncbi:hypothetical protein F4212_06485 [Candidatus Poribacteria bacterium]|nr:hypothetical protein [Candidatus Poribacteria bacterium]